MLYVMQAEVWVPEFTHGYGGPGSCVTESVIGPLRNSVIESQSFLLEAILQASPAWDPNKQKDMVKPHTDNFYRLVLYTRPA